LGLSSTLLHSCLLRRSLRFHSSALYTATAFHRFLSFFFNDPATPEIYPLSLHDALPICTFPGRSPHPRARYIFGPAAAPNPDPRSEEHTSELQSLTNLVCRLLLEKKKKHNTSYCKPDIDYTHLRVLGYTRYLQSN